MRNKGDVPRHRLSTIRTNRDQSCTSKPQSFCRVTPQALSGVLIFERRALDLGVVQELMDEAARHLLAQQGQRVKC